MEESQALCTKPKEDEAPCKESAGAKRANATEEAKRTKEPKETKDVASYSPHELGKRGEEAAACFLERREYEILDRNWKCIAGEADIVALQDDTLCFIEVKTRKDAQKGFPSEAVDTRKRSRYERIAACYLKDHDYADVRVRFDIIAILVLGEDRAFLRHHLNAFGSM
ncbi:MAG: YraN family protein [Eggerthella sp.]|nr:YraN family protein [Eggerthella sp.]